MSVHDFLGAVRVLAGVAGLTLIGGILLVAVIWVLLAFAGLLRVVC